MTYVAITITLCDPQFFLIQNIIWNLKHEDYEINTFLPPDELYLLNSYKN